MKKNKKEQLLADLPTSHPEGSTAEGIHASCDEADLDLASLMEGRLSPAGRTRLLRHLSWCGECRELTRGLVVGAEREQFRAQWGDALHISVAGCGSVGGYVGQAIAQWNAATEPSFSAGASARDYPCMHYPNSFGHVPRVEQPKVWAREREPSDVATAKDREMCQTAPAQTLIVAAAGKSGAPTGRGKARGRAKNM